MSFRTHRCRIDVFYKLICNSADLPQTGRTLPQRWWQRWKARRVFVLNSAGYRSDIPKASWEFLLFFFIVTLGKRLVGLFSSATWCHKLGTLGKCLVGLFSSATWCHKQQWFRFWHKAMELWISFAPSIHNRKTAHFQAAKLNMLEWLHYFSKRWKLKLFCNI